ncbi:MAG: ribosome small subunit-dependent GTPase A [Magnetococcales bacterium]|nr:ribosome small subunit-dependent GTPase A [Magnetococcales bacterium]
MPRKRSDKQLSLRQLERMRVARVSRNARVSGEDPSLEPGGGAGEPGQEESGRVVSHFGLNVEVEDQEGKRYRCAVREAMLDEPVCGDRVVWRRVGENQGVIVALEERLSLLRRPGPYSRLLTVAANVDRIVVVAAGGNLNTGLLDRYLAAAHKAGIPPIVVINKIDRVVDPEGEALALAPYPRMGYDLFRVSALSGEGLEPLEAALQGLTSVFVGESGVGKSSLVGCWIQDEILKTAAVHAGTGQGRHATTTARLYRLPRGGWLIDSPGVREFGLHGIVREEVPGLFRDMVPHLGRCRFSDCRHQREPGCALRLAVERGEIAEARLTSMFRIMESVAPKNPF